MRTAQLLVVVVALSCVGLSSYAEDGSGENARRYYELGRTLEGNGDLAGALEQYERALALRPSHRLHRHLGRVCQGLGRYQAAIAHYEQFLVLGGDRLTNEQREAIEGVLDDVRRRMATLRLGAPAGATVLVDGVSLGEAPFDEPIRLDPGQHRIEVRMAGFGDLRQDISLDAGDERSVELELSAEAAAPTVRTDETQILVEPPAPTEPSNPLEPRIEVDSITDPETGESGDEQPREDRRRSPRWLFWSGLGLSVGVLGGGVVFAGLTASEHDDFDALNRPDRTPSEDEDLQTSRDRGEAFGIAADVLLFTGAALAVTTLVLAFFTDFAGASESESDPIQELGWMPPVVAVRSAP